MPDFPNGDIVCPPEPPPEVPDALQKALNELKDALGPLKFEGKTFLTLPEVAAQKISSCLDEVATILADHERRLVAVEKTRDENNRRIDTLEQNVLSLAHEVGRTVDFLLQEKRR